ncbi:ABC transporter permease [Mucilaginibacter sp.]|uniref:ABC transporter permease n=1 Tax=Mucilaginibacter sp. TaxID=1882438 RepID=UPI0025F7F4AE|nr:ABC transporter permease [Mucilaginibacter sp.]
MYKNFMKIVSRNLWRYKSYTIINIVGMGIGIAAMVWGYQTYKYAFSFDNFHHDQDNVYRALTYKKGADGLKGVFPAAAVRKAKNDFAGIKEAVRFDSRGMNIKRDTGEAFSEQVHFTDPAFFKLFNFPLTSGDNNLADRSAVLITETVAKKYFGSGNPLGKTLTLYAGETYATPLTVRGVLKDVPLNSTIRFSIITGFDNELTTDGKKIAPDDWGHYLDAAYFYIPGAHDVARLEKELNRYLPMQNKARDDSKVSAFKLVTLRQNAAWNDVVGDNNLYRRPDDAATYGGFALACLIFLSACLNFSNTTVARANKRLKEIGMRKVMGSTHTQLMGQLLMECGVVVIAAILLSVLLNLWWLPAFNQMFNGIKVTANYLHDSGLLLFISCMLIGATVLAGAYPAFYLSRFKPASIFRGTVKFGSSNLFSRLMLGLQLTIAIITVIAGIAFSRNAAFQRDYDYGYTIENTMSILLKDTTTYAALKNELSSIPEVTTLAGAHNHIGFSRQSAIAETGGIKKEIRFLEVGREYPAAMHLKMAAGRSFDAANRSDYANDLLISEQMAAMYGWTQSQALGKRVRINGVDYSVIGVLKDFHSETLFEQTQPLAMKWCKESKFQFLVVQSRPQDLTEVFAKVKDAWKKLYPLKPFDGFYQNQLKAEAYRTTNSIAAIFFGFAIVSILLTATGLFALVSLTALKKMKEIAVRKVMGARPGNILVLINKGYFWIFIISAVLGCYGGWSFSKLLLDSIFKVNSGVGANSLIGSVTVLFIIAAGTSGIKVWQAVGANPVKLLRTE